MKWLWTTMACTPPRRSKAASPCKQVFIPVTVEYFQGTGGMDLELAYRGPGIEKQRIPASAFFHVQK